MVIIGRVAIEGCRAFASALALASANGAAIALGAVFDVPASADVIARLATDATVEKTILAIARPGARLAYRRASFERRVTRRGVASAHYKNDERARKMCDN